jgi:hypothetical protein
MRLLPVPLRARFCYGALVAFTFFLMVSFVVLDLFAPAGRRLAKIAGVDPPAYFGVAHAVLFHHNFDLTAEYRRVPPADAPSTAVRKETGRPGSEYAVGYSFLAMPFLALGTAADALAGNPADGYSRFAILGYCLANVALIGLGLIALFSFLHQTAELWSAREPSGSFCALIVALAAFFGTSAGYYAFSEMSHASTFFCASLFLAWWWKIRENGSVRSWMLLGLVGGLLSVCRWQDVFYLGGPLLFDAAGGFGGIRKRLPSRLAYAAVAALCWVPQLLEWKYIFGSFLVIPQGRDFFEFPPPFVLQVLFSSRSGWFLWTPLTLLGFCGLIFGAWKLPRTYVPWIVVIALEIGLTASLPTTWHGGDSFSSRYLTSCAPLVCFGAVTLLYASGRIMRRILLAAVTACCLFTILFAIQFRLDLIPRDDRLTPAECFTDKIQLREVLRQKAAVRRAYELLDSGSPDSAIAVLENTSAARPDRDVLSTLTAAYRRTGRPADAQKTEEQWNRLMQSRLW